MAGRRDNQADGRVNCEFVLALLGGVVGLLVGCVPLFFLDATDPGLLLLIPVASSVLLGGFGFFVGAGIEVAASGRCRTSTPIQRTGFFCAGLFVARSESCGAAAFEPFP